MKIIYDPKSDLKNWLRIKDKYPDNFTITEHYPFDKKITLTDENAKVLISSINDKYLDEFDKQANKIRKAWGKIETDIQNQIFNYLGQKLPIIDFTANLTTAYYMPYDEKDAWFMVPTHKKLNEQLKCITHELFHLYQAKTDQSLQQNEREIEVKKFIDTIDSFLES